MGVDYNNDGGTNRTLKAFGKIASNRNQVYAIDNSIEGNVWANDLGNPTREYAEAELARVTVELRNEKLLKFCNLSIVDSLFNTPYYVKITYSPAYLMQMLANMATKVGPMLGHNVSGKYHWAKISFVLSSGQNGFINKLGGLEDPHMSITYYLIVHNKFVFRV